MGQDGKKLFNTVQTAAGCRSAKSPTITAAITIACAMNRGIACPSCTAGGRKGPGALRLYLAVPEAASSLGTAS